MGYCREMTTTLLVRQDQLAASRLVSAPDAPLVDGQVRVRVDTFALTANNITYAALGDMLNYWSFFPSGEEGWGIVPVWGFGTVMESTHPDVAVGERLYGYWPMATEAPQSTVNEASVTRRMRSLLLSGLILLGSIHRSGTRPTVLLRAIGARPHGGGRRSVSSAPACSAARRSTR